MQSNEIATEKSGWFCEVIEYCQSVVDSKKKSCETEKAACQRFLFDYERIADDDYPYTFDFLKAWHVIAFIELLPHVKGHFAAQIGQARLIVLQPWQKFIIANLFGWVKKSDGLRRFTQAYIEVPRKNGKSVLAAGIGLYMLTADNEPGAEVYCGAGSLKQADEVFRPAKKMAEKTPSFRKAYSIDIRAKTIQTGDGSRFEPLIGKPGDGASPSCAIVDEYHEHPSSDLFETMVTGMGARLQPLMLVITTAGADLFGPCYDMHKDARDVLTGVRKWDDMFAVIYGVDEGDDWTDPEIIIKANPNYGISVGPDFIAAQQNKAKEKTNFQNAFKTKHLNIWCSAKNAYFNALNWEKCADKSLLIDDYQGETCYIGLDLAKKRDLSARVVVFVRSHGGENHYYVFPRFYLPEQTITHNDSDTLRALYEGWQNAGYLETCSGNEMDFRMIRDDVLDDNHQFDVAEVPHDPHGAVMISHELAEAGMEPVVLNQHGTTYTLPINELEAAIDSGRIHHDGNPVMSWCISNVIVHEYRGGNKMPDKQDNDSKIDGASALLMALNRAMIVEPEENIDDFLNNPVIA